MGSSSRQQIGEKFFMGMHHIIFQRPEDGRVSLKKIVMGKKLLWEGNLDTNTRITIDKPELFGGEKKEGGVQGAIDIEFGATDQTPNDYLQSAIQDAVPAFRHLIGTVWRQPLVTSMTPYVKKVEYVYETIVGESWYPETADIGGDCNPAHIVRDVVLNLMGKSESSLDDTAMRAAADTYYDEGLGLSLNFKGGSINKFLEDIERHTHSEISEDPFTGLIFMKPLRDDYDASSALHLTPSTNIKKFVSIERKTTSELTNELIIKYTPQGTDKTTPLTFHNHASILQQGATITQEISYPGITNAANAVAAAARDMPLVSTPLAKVELICNREAASLKRGDVVRLTWQDEGFSESVFRVLKVDYGSFRKREIKLVLTEDVFAAPSSTYLGGQSSLFVDPIQPASDFANQRPIELGYWDVVFSQGDEAVYGDDVAFAGGMVGQEPRYVSAMDMYFNLGGYNLYGSDFPAPTATLSQSIDRITTIIPIENATQGVSFFTVGYYVVLNDEIMRVDAISPSQLTVGRGCLDTIPQNHLSGDMIWFAEESMALSSTELSESQILQMKFVMNSGSDYFPIASASTNSITLDGRYGKPYPPANVAIGGSYFPATATDPIGITWSHRDRTQQLARPINDWYDGDIGPEAYLLGSGINQDGQAPVDLTFDVAYNLRIYDTAISTTTPIIEEKGIVNNSFNYPSDSAFFSNASGSDVINPYSSCTVFQNAVSSGLYLPGQAGEETYYNATLVYDDTYNSSPQISGPNAAFTELTNASLHTGMFHYSPSSSTTSSLSTGSADLPINLEDDTIVLQYSAFSTSDPDTWADVSFDIDFLDQLNRVVFSAKLEKENLAAGNKGNWRFIIAINDSMDFVYERVIPYGPSFFITLSAQNDFTLSASSNTGFLGDTSAISALCPVANVRTLRVVTSRTDVEQVTNVTTRSAYFRIQHSLTSNLLYPSDLSGRSLRAQLETVKLDNKSLQTYEHDFSVT